MEWNEMKWNRIGSNRMECPTCGLVLLSIPHLITLRTQVDILQIGIIITKVNHFALLFFLVGAATRRGFPIARTFIIRTPDCIDARQCRVQFRIFIDDLGKRLWRGRVLHVQFRDTNILRRNRVINMTAVPTIIL
jgi:hypothetical protein